MCPCHRPRTPAYRLTSVWSRLLKTTSILLPVGWSVQPSFVEVSVRRRLCPDAINWNEPAGASPRVLTQHGKPVGVLGRTATVWTTRWQPPRLLVLARLDPA